LVDYVKSQSELESQYETQLRFLQRSCDAFDDGDEAEAARLSATLRILLDERRNMHPLMGQLGRLDTTLFFSTVREHDPKNLAPNSGLLLLAKVDGQDKWKHEPILDSFDCPRKLPFNDWWNETVFSDLGKNEFTRKELVRSMADQDGGAHVDPTLNEKFAGLSRIGTLGHSTSKGSASCQIGSKVGVSMPLDRTSMEGEEHHDPMLFPELAGVRQIAHEVLKSLVPGYKKASKTDGARVQFLGFYLPEK
jgi:hypothetical protein